MTTAVTSRWTRREREAAAALGTQRVRRKRGERAPDVVQVRLEDGTVLQAEVKHRRHPLKFIAKALAQASAYAPGCVPLAVISAYGEGAVACLDLRHFVRLLGLRLPQGAQQLALVLAPAGEGGSR